MPVHVHAVVCFAIFSILTLHTACIRTEPFKDSNGAVIPNSIAVMETATIGGVAQSVWFRGLDSGNPALILLHGGPGISEAALFRHYDSGLENDFLVVYWEQRGAGRSYQRDLWPDSMTIDRFLKDLDEMVELVRARFHKEQVVLLGHSWGTVLGTMYAATHREKVAAYVGVGQIADMPAGERLSYEFARSQATQRNDLTALRELEEIGPPPHTVDSMLISRKWVERFGGAFHGDLTTGKLIWSALMTDEAGLIDLIKFGQGNRFSLLRLWPELSRVQLDTQYASFAMPVIFILGRYDQVIPAGLAERYFEKIQSPFKQLVWFEHSAHNPPFEEPDRFVRILVDVVRPLLPLR